MRGLWITLGPMLAAAALVLWGGERLARRTVEDRIPADRDRLFDFAAMLRGELNRLDRLYANHLSEIASGSGWLDKEAMAKRCENLVGLRSCSIFVRSHKEAEISGKKPAVGSASRVPEVIAEGEGGRFLSRNTIIIPKEVLEGGDLASGWLPGPEAGHRVHWIRTNPSRIVAFVVDENELGASLERHLAEWLDSP
jgi:hypothetical protein